MNLRRSRHQESFYHCCNRICANGTRRLAVYFCFALIIHLQLFIFDGNQWERRPHKKKKKERKFKSQPIHLVEWLKRYLFTFSTVCCWFNLFKSFISCTSLNTNLIILTDGFAIIAFNAQLCVRSMNNNLLECFFFFMQCQFSQKNGFGLEL